MQKRQEIMSAIELSYEELKGLEAYFRQLQRDAVVSMLKNSPVEKAALRDKKGEPCSLGRQQETST